MTLLLLCATSNVSSSDKFTKTISPDDFDKEKCIDVKGEVFQENLWFSEACEYGGAKCKGRPPTKKVIMWCFKEMLSLCFKEKGWITRQQGVGLAEDVEVGTSSSKVTIKNGEVSTTLCVFYN
jgi:hypothetical protein